MSKLKLMIKRILATVIFLLVVVLFGCRRKHYPQVTNSTENNSVVIEKSDSAIAKKPVFKPKKKDIIPNAITVNDKAAHKSIDGRFYYDLLGHRYWKNYTNGKYYLFNKSMYTNPDFKAPK